MAGSIPYVKCMRWDMMDRMDGWNAHGRRDPEDSKYPELEGFRDPGT